MSANPPATESSLPLLHDSQQEQKTQDQPAALSESEAMRRMQDLLAARKVSISDTVVFEYNQNFFTAQIMPDGSLKSHAQPSSPHHPNVSSPLKLYSSPSEFASDMAARALLLDEKVTRPRRKLSINGWINCTVNGRPLATIRNEMLHERKNESTSVSKEHVKGPSVLSKPGSEESPTVAGGPAEQTTTCPNPTTQDSQNSGQSDPYNPRDSCKPPESKRHEVPTNGEQDAKNKPTHSDLPRKQDATSKPHGKAYLDSASSSHQESDHEVTPISADVRNRGVNEQTDAEQGRDSKRGESSVVGKPSSDERSVKNCSAEQTREEVGSAQSPNSGGDLREEPRPTINTSDGQKDLDSKEQSDVNMVEPARRKAEREECSSYPESPRQENAPKDELPLKGEEDMNAEFKDEMEVEVIATLPSDRPPQSDAKETQEQDVNSSHAEESRNRIGNSIYQNDSPPRDQKNPTDSKKDTSEMSDDDIGTDKERMTSAEPVESKESTLHDNESPDPASSQFRSMKEVADLQQEILGDSDSDEDSLLEDDQKPASVLKKRSRSPSVRANRKRKRTGEYGSPETGGGNTAERIQQDSSKEGSNQGTRMETGAEGALDPETMEAAAIAAQIEKEEASNRARRTTRLAAGKIKQVDYKASVAAQAPRSVSPGHGSEENDRNSNDNESPAETTRASRRRTAPNQLYPPQRSSRRVAKLRNSQEKDNSSNDEIENQAGRSSSGGNGSESRTDKEVVHIEDTEVVRGQGSRPNGTRIEGSDRRRGRDTSVKRARHAYNEEGDHDSVGRAYSTRASTRENSVVDAAEITDLGDPNEFLSECEDVEDEEHIEDRTNGHGFTTADLTCIAEAVKISSSVDPADVLEALRGQETWKVDDLRNQKVEAFFHRIVDSVHNLSRSLSMTEEEVNSEKVLSFLSAEVWRLSTGGLNTGVPRKPTAVLRKATREDQIRATLERSRRKEHRDVEEMRGTLEKEMESRRRAELDTLYVEIQVSEANRALSRERARCCRVEQETEKYRDMEAEIRKRLEKAKILVGQLRGERDESDAANHSVKKELHQDETLRIEPRLNGSFATSPVVATRNSATSDDDIEMTDKNITTTSHRVLEMDRLRVLIAAREAEAEEYQRICEKERMRFESTLELKNRLETEIYLYKSHGAVAYGTGNASSVPLSGRLPKENVKKGDHRGPSAYGNRGPGYVKQKTGVAKNGGSVQGVPSLKNNAATSKSKVGPGRAVEAPKPTKRKPIAKTGGSEFDKV